MERRRKLLIADDDRQLCSMLSDFFSKDYDIFCAFDGADALMLAVEHRPDLVLLDITMPILDGRTICKKLKDNPLTKDTCIIMVTGKSAQYDRLVGFEVGADDYVEKPVSLEYLARIVEGLLRERDKD